MNLKTITMGLILIPFLLNCTSKTDESKQNELSIQPQPSQELPVQMIKTPDGEYYFPSNIHRPKSDKDSLVWVLPSDFK